MTTLTALKSWTFALKLNSWPKILIPSFLGQCIGILVADSFNYTGFILGTSFSLCLLFVIVLLNDWGDQKVDGLKRAMFPETSKKTIYDGILDAKSILKVGLTLLGFSLLIAYVGATELNRPHFFTIAALGLALFFGYTFHPLRLNYRGGGEILETLGVGFLLPYLNAYSYSNALWHPLYFVFISLLPLAFTSALASGMVDEESDLVGGKKTFCTIYGNPWIRYTIQAVLCASPLVWLGMAFFLVEYMDFVVWIGPSICVYLATFLVIRSSPYAVTRAFKPIKTYKNYLHLGIWGAQLVLGIGLLAMR